MDHKQTKTKKALLRRNLHKICATPPAFHFSLWTDVNEHPTNNKVKQAARHRQAVTSHKVTSIRYTVLAYVFEIWSGMR